MRATPLPLGAPTGATCVVIRRVGDEVEMVNLRWGARPEDEILITPPAGVFTICPVGAASQHQLAL